MGKTKEMYVLPSHFTEVITGTTGLSPVEGYQVTHGRTTKYRKDDVMHYKANNLYWENGEAYYGASPLRAGARVLTKSNANEDAAVSMFQNLGIKGILTDASTDNQWTADQVAQVERSFYRKFGGPDKRKILITNGDVRWQDIGLSPVDMALLEDHLQNLRTICSLYKVSSRLFNDPAASTYNNMEQDVKNAWLNAILPLVQGWVDNFNRWLSPAYAEGNRTYELYVRKDNIQELQDDKKALAEMLNAAWWISFNEKRSAMDFPPVDGMDNKFFIPSMLLPIDEDQLDFDAARQLESRT